MANMNKKTILIITDGIGHNENENYNAFKLANTPTYDYMFKNVAFSYIKTSGLAVGLPQGQMGNSEVGHMSIGSGEVLDQNLVQISKSIQNKTLKDNIALNNLIKKSKNIHLIGLLSDGGVHSHINHLNELAKICAKKINHEYKVYIHAITDGRDVGYKSAIKYIQQIELILNDKIKLASIAGRFYTMDRDNRWDRIQKGFEVMSFGANQVNLNFCDYIHHEYQKEIYDEFITPASFGGFGGILPEDGIVFTNFRNDRMRQIVIAYDENFKEFDKSFSTSNIITMTTYDKNFTHEIMFESILPKTTLAKTISQANLRQLHTAETEKYAHVTFFLNGGVEQPNMNETHVLVPSPKVNTYDLKPQMSLQEVTNVVIDGINNQYDFIVTNFANGDMVGHTGNLKASIKAVEAVDFAIGEILKKAQENKYNIIITSDHGNCELMRFENGEISTNHTTFDVYCFIISPFVKKINNGKLSNIAPSVLKLMGLKIPKSMDVALF